MQVVSLIAARGGLEAALPEGLRNAWGGGDVVWLSPDEAAEFVLAAVPENFAEVAAELRRRGVDVNALPVERRRKRLLLADMDSTIIQQECIDELAAEAGVGERVAEITARAMNGDIGFEGALTERVGLLSGLEDTVIETVWRERIALMPGAGSLVATMKANGAYCALVSGGFTAFTSRVAGAVGFDRHQANVLGVEGGRLTGQVVGPILGREAKAAALEELCRELGITMAEALAVGDGANDLGMLGRAGLGVAMHAKPVVAEAARARVDHGDLTALLYLQGYSIDELVN